MLKDVFQRNIFNVLKFLTSHANASKLPLQKVLALINSISQTFKFKLLNIQGRW